MTRHRILISLLLLTRPLFALDCWGQFYECVDGSNFIRQCHSSRETCFGAYPEERQTSATSSVDMAGQCSSLGAATDSASIAGSIAEAQRNYDAAQVRLAQAQAVLNDLPSVLANNGNDEVIQGLMAGSQEEAQRRLDRARADSEAYLAIISCGVNAQSRIASSSGPTAPTTPTDPEPVTDGPSTPVGDNGTNTPTNPSGPDATNPSGPDAANPEHAVDNNPPTEANPPGGTTVVVTEEHDPCDGPDTPANRWPAEIRARNAARRACREQRRADERAWREAHPDPTRVESTQHRIDNRAERAQDRAARAEERQEYRDAARADREAARELRRANR